MAGAYAKVDSILAKDKAANVVKTEASTTEVTTEPEKIEEPTADVSKVESEPEVTTEPEEEVIFEETQEDTAEATEEPKDDEAK